MFEFGPFRLDEPARALRVKDREIALQPRVFDLLAYLVKNRDRVVSKDELLDNLWSGVTVTDNSLQRAVSSLRMALREGGMEDAVKNFPRSGYRFVSGEIADAPAAIATESASASPIEEARHAIEDQRWRDARKLFAEIDAKIALQPSDLDLWALALLCLGDAPASLPLFVRAVEAYAKTGKLDKAAVDAATLAMLHLERGEAALAKGWIARAQDFSRDSDARARGFVTWAQSRMAAFDGEPVQAEQLANVAYELGRESQSLTVETLALMYRGFYRLSLGDTRAGLADQDHAAAISLSGNIDPFTGAILYCNILWACRTFGDWSRANQWTVGYQDFCTSGGMEFSGSCQLHRAEVLGVQGSLEDAKAHIDDALSKLTDDAPWAIGDAHRVLGDIQAAIGNDEEALAAYDKSYAAGWNPEPGRAMLLLERGNAEGAYSAIERGLLGQSWWTLQRQGMLLAHLAIVAAAAGKTDRAKAVIADLAGQETRWPMPSIRALTNEASALLARREGDLQGALRHLHLARQLWTSIDSRLNAARLRLCVAETQCELGDKTGAATELRIVCPAIEALKSVKMKKRYDALEKKLKVAA